MDSTNAKSCCFCKHYFCLINQGIWGCKKNYTYMMTDASKCEGYEEAPSAFTYDVTYDYSKQKEKDNDK